MSTASESNSQAIEARNWLLRLSGYRQPNVRRSLWELLITAIPFALAWSAMLTALKLEQFWLYALLIVPAAGLLVRLFMIQHELRPRLVLPQPERQ